VAATVHTGSAPVRELFIYYRIDSANADEAFAAITQMQRLLRERRPGLAARLLRRLDPPTPTQTWMEIYSLDDAAGVSPELEAEIAGHAAVLERFFCGPRHTEVFAPCAS